jgi:allophanate hydrolase
MLRVGDETGHSIDVEVWRMPPAGFGKFVDLIPSPLGIGTVQLEDGTSAKGFLVEPIGLEGATDISDLGGWRAYLSAKA